MRTAQSKGAFCCGARSQATWRLQGTTQMQPQARATSPHWGATLLLLAEGPPLWDNSTLLLAPERFRGSGRGLALDLQATPMKSPRLAALGR